MITKGTDHEPATATITAADRLRMLAKETGRDPLELAQEELGR